MKKIQIFAMTALLASAMASCSETPVKPNELADSSAAYLSIKVNLQKNTRSSDENPGAGESDINSIYLVTFDDAGKIVGIPGGSAYYIALTGTKAIAKPAAQRVSAAATNLVVIANPGAKLLDRLNTLSGSSSIATFNAAIAGVTAEDVTSTEKGFVMISTPSDAEMTAGDPITYPYVDIEGKLALVTTTEAAAREEAEKEENRVPVTIERLASKLVLNYTPGSEEKPAGSTFTFRGWTVDAVNTTYFPFAEKKLRDNHTPTVTPPATASYKFNFYTKDPNYDFVDGGYHSGLAYGTVTKAAPTWWAPVLAWTTSDPVVADAGYYGWKSAGQTAYAVENTMEAKAQQYGNATRLVIKATYYPGGITSGDWFQYAGENYKTITELQVKYAASEEGSNLRAACDQFLAQIKAYFTETGKTGGPASDATFADLNATMLTNVENGGEVAKVAKAANGPGVGIRWFQNGLNYYFYEIRHDNDADKTMEYAKYGVVRNNWYNLTLNSVSGQGTPWYPDLVNPGDGDPDPKDDIDQAVGFIGISITPQPWIVWERGFGI